jgi:hypothetical protein
MGGALGLAILSGVATSAITSAMTNGTASSLTAASVTGYDAAFRAAAIFTLFALLVAIFIIRQPKSSSAKVASETVSLH